MENLLFLGVPILKHIRVIVFDGYKSYICLVENKQSKELKISIAFTRNILGANEQLPNISAIEV